jgi:hypothetical protein
MHTTVVHPKTDFRNRFHVCRSKKATKNEISTLDLTFTLENAYYQINLLIWC